MPSFGECGISPLCWGKGLIGEGIAGVAESIVDLVASAVSTAAEAVFTFVAEALMWTDPVEVASNTGVTWLQGSLHNLTSLLALTSVIAAAGMMVWHQRGSPLRDLARSLGVLAIVSSAGVMAIDLATSAADEFGSWLLDSSGGMDSLATNMTTFLAATGPLGAFLVIILGLMSIVGGLIQVGLLMVRSVFLLLMAGVFPLSAAATNMDWGRQWFNKCLGWIMAFVIYKPTVAIIFSLGLRLMNTAGVEADAFASRITEICEIEEPTAEDYASCIEDHPDDFADLRGDLLGSLTGFMQGLMLLILSCVALSAITKFIVPSVAALSAGSGAVVAGLGSTAAVAMGARSVSSSSGGDDVHTGAADNASNGDLAGGGRNDPGGSSAESDRRSEPVDAMDGPPGSGESGESQTDGRQAGVAGGAQAGAAGASVAALASVAHGAQELTEQETETSSG